MRDDGAGNIFARWPGKDDALPPVATGSHIDAIPNAGRYDGVVGVLGALEAIRALQRAGFEPARPIELIVFAAEEPTRFGIGCLGSRLLAGALSLEQAAALRDGEGRSLDELRGVAGLGGHDLRQVRLAPHCYSGFVELHIEQGPMLERENLPIGIVEKIAAPSTLRVQLTGVGGHAGGMLMPERHDACWPARKSPWPSSKPSSPAAAPTRSARRGYSASSPARSTACPAGPGWKLTCATPG